MITIFLVFYAFMAGMTAEYANARAKALVFSERVWLASSVAAILWPLIVFGDVE